jgi:hypothetical protein
MPTRPKPRGRGSPFYIDLHDDEAHGLANAQQRAFEAAVRFSARAMRGALAAQGHALGFAAQRLQRDLDTARRLAACQAAPEAMAIAQDHCIRTVADYAEEATALMRLGASALAGDEPGA